MACTVSACLAAPVARRVALASARGFSASARAACLARPVIAHASPRRCARDAHRAVRAARPSARASPGRGLAAHASRSFSARAASAAVDETSGAALYEAVVVVAGGIEDDGTLPAWVLSRLDLAAAEYFRHAKARPRATPPTYVVLSGSATPHKPPPVQRGGFTYHESTAMAEYLMEKWKVPASALLKDTASMDTIGNAYFSLMLHAAPRGWRSVLVVTSAFHMPRTRAAFEWVFGLYDGGGDKKIELAFQETPNDGLDKEVVAARAEREAASEAALRENQQRVVSMPAFAEWLYTTHMCYAVGRQHEIGAFEEMKNDPALKSY
jgi:hypothetical protein